MSLNDIFQAVASIAFEVFESISQDIIYVRSGDDLGWGDGPSDTETPLKAIPLGHEEKAVKESSFYNLIQPLDIVMMVKGSSLRDSGVSVSVSDTVKAYYGNVQRTFSIASFDSDPAKAVYLLLLRSVKVSQT